MLVCMPRIFFDILGENQFGWVEWFGDSGGGGSSNMESPRDLSTSGKIGKLVGMMLISSSSIVSPLDIATTGELGECIGAMRGGGAPLGSWVEGGQWRCRQ